MNKNALQSQGGLLWQTITILIAGVSVGAFAAQYSPLIATIIAFFMACGGMILYHSSVVHPKMVETSQVQQSVAQPSKNTILFYLFYLSFFLSITIPKAGKTISNIPITIANLAILLALVGWGIHIMLSQKEQENLPAGMPILLFIGYGIVASFIGYLNHFALKNIIIDFSAFFGFIPVYFLVCAVVKTRKRMQVILATVIVSLLLVSLYGSLQPRLGFERIAVPGLTQQANMIMYEGVLRWNMIEGGMQKVYSTFQNGNVFGNHLALFIPFFAGILLGIRSFTRRMVAFGIFLLSCYTLFITYSRGALVGAVCGILFFAVISKKIRLKTFVIIFLFGCFGAGLFMTFKNRPEFNRFNFQRATDNPNQFSAGRVYRAKLALAAYEKLPISAKFLGVGLGGPHPADNLYLTLLMKIGLVGMAILFWTLLKLLSEFLQLKKSIANLQIQSLLNGGMAGLIASLIHNIVDVLWFFPPLAANFWFLAGLTMCIGLIGVQEEQALPKNLHGHK